MVPFLTSLIPWHRLDRVLLVALVGLIAFGTLFVYSATHNNDLFTSASWLRQPYFKQIIFYGIGIGLAFLICLKDYNQLARWAQVFFWLSMITLVLVLIP